MAAGTPRRRYHSRGSVSFLALLLLAVFATLGAVHYASSTMNMLQASNFRGVLEARLAAESGVGYLTRELQISEVSGALRGQALLRALAAEFGANLDGTGNLNGQTVSYDGTTLTIPNIAFDSRKAFSAQLTSPAHDVVQLTVTGRFTDAAGETIVQRRVSLDFHPTGDPAFGFALACRGPITMGMNSEFLGVALPSDGSMYSASNHTAISIPSGHITGDVCVSEPGAIMALGMTQVDGEEFYDVPPITMPEIDRSAYEAMATNIVDSSTNFNGGTFTNIRVKANTNPQFGSVTIRGVMYVESPNYVYFKNNVNFTGVIVAEDPAPGSPDSANTIYFKNNASFNSVADLPGEPQFAALRELSGTTVLAPGFTMEFKNNLTSAAGVVAVKALISKNNLTSSLYGTMLIYGDGGLTFKNNSVINVDYSRYPRIPKGFQGYGLAPMVADPETYTEH